MKLRFSRRIFVSHGVDIFINFNKFDAAAPDAPVGVQIHYLALIRDRLLQCTRKTLSYLSPVKNIISSTKQTKSEMKSCQIIENLNVSLYVRGKFCFLQNIVLLEMIYCDNC